LGMLSLLGTAPAPTLRKWFSSPSKAGRVVEDLQMLPGEPAMAR
jgi:hypothetical protein